VTTGRPAPVRRARSGAVPTFLSILLAGSAVVLLGVSPSLNPLDLLIGRAFDVVVPSVAGLTETRALVVLRSKNLHGRVAFRHSTSVERGRVISTRPTALDTVRSGANVTVNVSRGPTRVVLPDFGAKTEAEATRKLARLGLVSRVDRVNDENASKGVVFHQVPLPGEVVGGGSTVRLTVSLGAAPRGVPDVTKLAIEGALFNLGRAGFTLGTVTGQDDSTLPVNAVLRTDPTAGEIRDRDTAVNVVVSSGPAAVAVPSVIGKTYADAAASLTASGLVPAIATKTVPPGDPTIGTVVAQSPAGGAGLRPGQVVTLTVGQAG